MKGRPAAAFDRINAGQAAFDEAGSSSRARRCVSRTIASCELAVASCFIGFLVCSSPPVAAGRYRTTKLPWRLRQRRRRRRRRRRRNAINNVKAADPASGEDPESTVFFDLFTGASTQSTRR